MTVYRGNPNIGPKWKPGQSGNPLGKPKLPEALKGIKGLTQMEANRLISKYARMILSQLKDAIANPLTPVVDLAICSIWHKSIQQGDYQRLAFLLDRAIGKVPLIKDEDDEEKAAREELEGLSTTELLKVVKDHFGNLDNAS